LQNFLAFAVALKRSFNGFDLAPDPPNARERLRLVFRDMRQIILRLKCNILPYTILLEGIIGENPCWKQNAE
jgi:hypothetical protein